MPIPCFAANFQFISVRPVSLVVCARMAVRLARRCVLPDGWVVRGRSQERRDSVQNRNRSSHWSRRRAGSKSRGRSACDWPFVSVTGSVLTLTRAGHLRFHALSVRPFPRDRVPAPHRLSSLRTPEADVALVVGLGWDDCREARRCLLQIPENYRRLVHPSGRAARWPPYYGSIMCGVRRQIPTSVAGITGDAAVGSQRMGIQA